MMQPKNKDPEVESKALQWEELKKKYPEYFRMLGRTWDWYEKQDVAPPKNYFHMLREVTLHNFRNTPVPENPTELFSWLYFWSGTRSHAMMNLCMKASGQNLDIRAMASIMLSHAVLGMRTPEPQEFETYQGHLVLWSGRTRMASEDMERLAPDFRGNHTVAPTSVAGPTSHLPREFILESILSTSLDRRVAEQFLTETLHRKTNRPVLFKIHVGSPEFQMLRCPKKGKHDFLPSEEEVVITPGSVLRWISSRETEVQNDHPGVTDKTCLMVELKLCSFPTHREVHRALHTGCPACGKPQRQQTHQQTI